MKKNLVLVALAVIAYSMDSNPVEAADLVVEVENLELVNAQVRDLETASGKVVAFDVKGAQAKGEVELDRGVYKVYLDMFAPDPEQDAVYVAIGETHRRIGDLLSTFSPPSLRIRTAPCCPIAGTARRLPCHIPVTQ